MATIIENMSNADYHAHSAISKSGLDLIEKSPAHFFYAEREKTKEMVIGSAFHDLVLLPETFNELYIIKPAEMNFSTKAGKEWKQQSEESGKEILTEEEFKQISAMKESVLAHHAAGRLLSSGKPETSIFWKDEIGVECRCRPDFININNVIVDLKTTTDASPKGFAKSVANFRYHVQDTYYCHGYKHAFGELPRGFVFVAIEKKPPYAVGVYTLDDLAKAKGEMRFKENLLSYKQALAENAWHAFSQKIETLSLPNWAFKS